MTLTLCSESFPNLFGVLDTGFAPTLLYYSYIPILVISLFFSIFVLISSKYSKQSIMLLLLSLSFCLWIVNEMAQWLFAYSELVMFSWQLIALTQSLIFYFSVILISHFTSEKPSNYFYTILNIFLFSVLILIPTRLNIASFDQEYCEGVAGPLWLYIYILEILAIIWIIFNGVIKSRVEKEIEKKPQIKIVTFGSVILLLMFLVINVQIEGDSALLLGIIPLSGIFKTILGNYEINLIGPLGMVAFLAFLSFMIVKFKTFNIKLLGTQAFVWAVVILIGSQFFFIQTNVNRVLNSLTLITTSVLGLLIVRGVKKEIALKDELLLANENQQLLIRFITHQVKGFFTKSKAIFAGMLDGDFGTLDDIAKGAAKEGLESDNKAVMLVQEVLNASSLRAGTTQFNFEKIDFGNMVKEIADDFIKVAEEKGVQYEMNIPENMFAMVDKTQMIQVIKNLIDNSVKYTQKGSIIVSLIEKKIGKKYRLVFSVKDTGVGLSEHDKQILFTEGGRGEESLRLNVNSTGYGLFIVKKIVDGHHGLIWAESDGREKGATFFVEIEEVR